MDESQLYEEEGDLRVIRDEGNISVVLVHSLL